MPPTEGKRIDACLVAQCWSCSWKAGPYRWPLDHTVFGRGGKGVRSAMTPPGCRRAGTLNFYSFTCGGFVTGS
ncbi:hypothetical protein [Pseudonocardia sp.]|jgi:hypothetical protein|uniref:hypothetical protein n=1 Tax=Pseudonocardia sp. TaxID=60912 RepID=UPI0031FE0766